MPFASRVALLLLALMFLTSGRALTQNSGEDQAEFGKNITIAPGQSSGDIACGRCSVNVRGTVNGDIAVFSGRVVVEGTVKGDIAVFMGRIRLEKDAHVGGDMAVMGGNISRDPTASVGGDVKSIGAGWLVIPLVGILVFISLFIGFIVWLVTRNRRAPPTMSAPGAA